MKTTDFAQKEIEITSVRFRNNPSKQRFDSYPKRMVFEGREYTFLDSGMQFLVRTGQDLIKLFDMSDGQTQYRLKVDGNNRWTLVDMKACA